MSTKFTSCGYSCYCTLGLGSTITTTNLILLTSYTLTINRNIIKSNGCHSLVNTDGLNSLTSLGGSYLSDCPDGKLSISYEASSTDIINLFNFLKNNRTESCIVNLEDETYQLSFNFNECFLTSASFSVNENSLIVINLEFYIPLDNSYMFSINGITNPIEKTERILPTDLCVFYRFSVKLTNEEVKNLIGFTYNFTQNINPLYGMLGSYEDKAQKCYKVIFGIPEITMSLSIFAADSNTQDMSILSGYTDIDIRNQNIELLYNTTSLVKYTGIILGEITTAFADSNAGNAYDLNYSVIGSSI